MSSDRTERAAWDDVGQGWLSTEDRERLDRKRAARHPYEGSDTQTAREAKLEDVRIAYDAEGRPPSAARVAAHSDRDIAPKAYRMDDVWGETLRAAGVPAVEDVLAGWLHDRVSRPEASNPFVFRAADVARDTGLASSSVGLALRRFVDGTALDPEPPLNGEVFVVHRPGSNGPSRWGYRL